MNFLEEIRKDLTAFADPGSQVIITDDTALWEQDGSLMDIEFRTSIEGGYPDIIIGNVKARYKNFLAGSQMADLNHLADFIKKTIHVPSNYIDTLATLEDEETTTIVPATELVAGRATTDLPFLSTRVVLVQGEAGSGKTIALRKMTIDRATQYLTGVASTLFFYVDAQGRALSRLDDAMAKDLQDLRSKFSYTAVARLARHNLLVPVIDGFDELLGSGGYAEAFSSLAAFLSTLEGSGAVVASARSAFFDYRNFYDNAQKYSHDGNMNYAVDPVRVHPWTIEQIETFTELTAKKHVENHDRILGAVSDLVRTVDGSNHTLLTKPFYVAKVVDLALEGTQISSEEALLDQLVSAFIQREHAKLLNKEGQPLLSLKGHSTFLTQLAEEMWWQESRSLDVGTVQTVAEIVTEDFGLPPGAAKSIVERVAAYAFLSTVNEENKDLRFEHEVFYGYFLAHKLREYIEREPTDLRRFLNRSILDETLAEQAVRLIGVDVERCSRAVEAVCAVIRSSLTDVVARDNAGKIVSALIRSAGKLHPGITIQNVIFRQSDFGQCHLEEPHFVNCYFQEVDFRAAVFNKPTVEGCGIHTPSLDIACTRFIDADATLADQVHSVRIDADQGEFRKGNYFDPRDIRAILTTLGMISNEVSNVTIYPELTLYKIRLLEKFLLKMERRFYVSRKDLDALLRRDPGWPELWKLLNKHSLIVEEVKQKSGPSATLLRLAFSPEIIRRGEDVMNQSLPTEVRSFWKEVLSE